MAERDESEILLVSGRLCYGPGDPTSDFPCGGTELGLVKGVVLKPLRAYDLITEEAFGNEVVEAVDLGEAWQMTVGFRSFDSDMLQKVFCATEEGDDSGDHGIVYPAGSGAVYRAGRQRSQDAIDLYFYPDDPAKHPSVRMYAALPFVDADADLAFQHGTELVTPVTFFGIRDASNRVISVRKVADQPA